MSFWHVVGAKLIFWKSNQDLVLGRIASMTESDFGRLAGNFPLVRKVSLAEKRRIASAAVREMSGSTVKELIRSL